jgi:transposase-like protein
MNTEPRAPRRTHDWAPYRPRLTPEEVGRIRAERAAGATLATIARAHGVSTVHVWRVCQERDA